MTKIIKFLAPLGLLLLTAQTCTVSAPVPPPGPGPGPGPRFEARTFVTPQINGAVVDWCSPWARNCGRPTANRYCRRQGYDRAVRWTTYRPGRTWVMRSGRYCRGPACKGFRRIRCVRR